MFSDFPLYSEHDLTVADTHQLLLSTLRLLMSWNPRIKATQIDRDFWLHKEYANSNKVGKCFEINEPEGKHYIRYPEVGGGRFSTELPVDVTPDDVTVVRYPDELMPVTIMGLQRGLESFPGYRSLIEDVIRWVNTGTPCGEELDCLRQLQALYHRTGPLRTPNLRELDSRIYPAFFSYRFCGESLTYFTIIKEFNPTRGVARLTGSMNTLSMEDSSCLVNALALEQSLSWEAFADPISPAALKRAAYNLIEYFVQPHPRERLYLVRFFCVIELAERLYFEGVELVKKAKRAESLGSFYDHIFYAHVVLSASFICYNVLAKSLSGEGQENMWELARRSDELLVRTITVMSIPCHQTPYRFFMDEIASGIIVADRQGALHKYQALADLFDNQLILPDFCRDAICAEVERNNGSPSFSGEFMTFFENNFQRVLVPSWAIQKKE